MTKRDSPADQTRWATIAGFCMVALAVSLGGCGGPADSPTIAGQRPSPSSSSQPATIEPTHSELDVLAHALTPRRSREVLRSPSAEGLMLGYESDEPIAALTTFYESALASPGITVQERVVVEETHSWVFTAGTDGAIEGSVTIGRRASGGTAVTVIFTRESR